MSAPVVVGIDDSQHSAEAMTAAAHEARLRKAPLWLAHAYHWLPPVVTGITPGSDSPEGAVRDAATALLTHAAARLHVQHPDLDIHHYAISGQPGPGLADLARDAALLVIGGRGRGGFTGMLLGSVALSTIAHTHCPILVTRGRDNTEPAAPNRRIVLGIDITPPTTGADVVGFAFDEAHLHGYDLHAVHAWEDPGYFPPAAIGPYPHETLSAMNVRRRHRLESRVSPWRDKYPDILVDTEIVNGSPSRSLIDASRTADMLILGAHRCPDKTRTHLGGLAHAVLHHAHCPVIIVPEA